MNEYICKEDFIKILKEKSPIPFVETNVLIGAVSVFPSADVQPVKWIPVTERLPESVCKSYLCLTNTGYHCEARWTNNVYGLWKSDNKWGWSIADVPQYCKVTHWMPLPEPPKDGKT